MNTMGYSDKEHVSLTSVLCRKSNSHFTGGKTEVLTTMSSDNLQGIRLGRSIYSPHDPE